MDAFALMLTFIFVGYASSEHGKPLSIRKCCSKGMQLDSNAKSCLYERDRNIPNENTEILYPPINYTIYSWIPDKLRLETLSVKYGDLSDVELDVSATYMCNDLTVHRDFPGNIHRSLIQEERYCYDSTPNRACVIFKGVKLKPIPKCCAKGERLNADGKACEAKEGVFQQEATQDIVFHPVPQNSLSNNISQSVFNIQYNALKSGFNFYKVVLENATVSWETRNLQSGSAVHTMISYQGVNDTGNAVSGSRDIFCFDEVPSGARVMLAAEYHVPKCCGKNEELTDAASACIPLPDRRLEHVKSDILDREIDSDNVYWLPSTFPLNRTAVRYDTIFKMSKYSSKLSIFPDDRIRKLELDRDTNLLRVKIKGSKEVSLKPMDYCFDSLIGSGRVIVVHTPKHKNSSRKCSFPEDVLKRQIGKPQIVNYPFIASYDNERPPIQITPTNLILPVYKHCKHMSNETHFDDSSIFNKLFQDEWVGAGERSEAGPCGAWESEIVVTEAVPSCSFPGLWKRFGMVRQVGATAAALLAVGAAVVITARRTTRQLAHGRALACHALCLAAANTLQVAAFYQWPTLKAQCVPYLYFTYFFMVSGNWWLTAITYNIFQTFRLPLGEMAAASSRASQRRRFAVMSMIAWGGSGTLTLVAVIMHQLKYRVRPLGLVAPTFFETRTCSYEFEFYKDEENGVFYLDNRFGPVSYHCTPTGILAALNLVLVIMTVRRLHVLRRGSSILQGKHSDDTSAFTATSASRLPSHLENALFYAKLLMTTGIAELSMEAATWSTNHGAMRYYVLNQTIVLSYEKMYKFALTNNVLDLVRALCVFWMSTGRFWRAERGWKILQGWVEVIKKWAYSPRKQGQMWMEANRMMMRACVRDVKSDDVVAHGEPTVGNWSRISVK